MRALVLLMTAVLLACGTEAAVPDQSHLQSAALSPEVELLLASAAADFRTHGPRPLRFRDVRSGYVMTSAGTKQHRLCGQVLATREGNEAEWIAFATILTSPYEQWMGGQATPFCTDASMLWDERDLSSPMQGRIDQRSE